jgi:predicted ATP-grasp superfamily ATP-dependent carboligase
VSIADLPSDGECIEPGHPVLTVFASSQTQRDVESKLTTLIREILERLDS